MSNLDGFDTPEDFDQLIMDFDEEMTFDEYQEEAVKFAFYKGSVIYPTLGLAGEAGEVAEKIKKLMRDSDIDFNKDTAEEDLTAAQTEAIALELSDVLWYLANIANDIGYSLEEIAELNLEKLNSRKMRGKLQGSGDNR